MQNENFKDKDFKPTSTEPMIRVQGMMEGTSDSSDDGSDDSNLYYEFNSDSEMSDVASISTMSTTNKPPQSRPMIVDITPSIQTGPKADKLNKKKKKRLHKNK